LWVIKTRTREWLKVLILRMHIIREKDQVLYQPIKYKRYFICSIIDSHFEEIMISKSTNNWKLNIKTMAIYSASSYGKQVIADEQLTESPITRIVLSLLTLLFGCYIEYLASKLFCQLWSQKKRSFIITTLFCAYFSSVLFHTVHYTGISFIIKFFFIFVIWSFLNLIFSHCSCLFLCQICWTQFRN